MRTKYGFSTSTPDEDHLRLAVVVCPARKIAEDTTKSRDVACVANQRCATKTDGRKEPHVVGLGILLEGLMIAQKFCAIVAAVHYTRAHL